MREPFKDEKEAAEAFDEWRQLFTKGRYQLLSSDERERIRVLSKRLGEWFKPD